MIAIEFPEQINWDICVQSAEERFVDIHNPDYPHQLTDPQIVFGKDSKFFFEDPYGELIHRYITPIVSRAIGRRLYSSNSFGWVYFNGGEVIQHLDRDYGVQWLGSLTIEQDQDWEFRTFINDKTITEQTKVGRMIAMNGSQYTHSKPVYKGKRAINYLFSFNESKQKTLLRRQYVHATDISMDLVQLASDINLSVHPNKYYQIPLYIDPVFFQHYWTLSVNYINQWTDNIVQSSSDYQFAIAPGPLLPLQEQLRLQVEHTVDQKLTAALPKIALFHHSEDNVSFEWETDSVEDYIAILPLALEGQVKIKYGYPFNHKLMLEDPSPQEIVLDATKREYAILPVCCTEMEYISGGTDFAVLGYQKVDKRGN